MAGTVDLKSVEIRAKAEAEIAHAAKKYDVLHIPRHFEGNYIVGYRLKTESLTAGEAEAVAYILGKKSIKALIDKESDEANPALKAGGLVATAEWVADKCKAFGCK